MVRLSRYVRVPYRREVPLTRRAVLDRDRHACAYCGARADTIDHVRPRSRGGEHIWANVVAACARCNHRKGNHLLAELGWHLASPPTQPPATVAVVLGWAKRDPAWQRYLALDWTSTGRTAYAVGPDRSPANGLGSQPVQPIPTLRAILGVRYDR